MGEKRKKTKRDTCIETKKYRLKIERKRETETHDKDKDL